MKKLFTRIQELLTRDLREAIFRREEPKPADPPVVLAQATEPTEKTVSAVKAKKPRARRAGPKKPKA